MADPRPGYWAVVPSVVRYDEDIPPNAKILYAEISALTDERGYCYAQNAYFCRVYGWSQKTVSRLLVALKEKQYIQVDVVRNRRTNGVEERRIYAGINPALNLPPKNVMEVPSKLSGRVPDKNEIANNVDQVSVINNPPTPQGGNGGRRRKREPKEVPDWNPERFAGLWAYYPSKGKKDKQSAIRAWDELRPDDPLIAKIGQAIKKLKASEEWQRGVGIPYVATFLRGRRWEDAEAVDEPDPVAAEGGTTYEDRRLL